MELPEEGMHDGAYQREAGWNLEKRAVSDSAECQEETADSIVRKVGAPGLHHVLFTGPCRDSLQSPTHIIMCGGNGEMPLDIKNN